MIKSYLLFKEKDFIRNNKKTINDENKIFDLEIKTILEVMEDLELEEVLLRPLDKIEDIKWRQCILKDFINNDKLAVKLKSIGDEFIEEEQKILHSLFSEYPINRVNRGILVIEMFLEKLKKVENELKISRLESEGLNRLFKEVTEVLDEKYLRSLKKILVELKFNEGIYVKGKLGKGNKLNKLRLVNKEKEDSLMKKIIHKKEKEFFLVDERDSGALDTITLIKNKSLNEIGNVIENVCNGMKEFFINLSFELKFYIGGIKLYENCIKNKIHTSYGEEERNFKIKNVKEVVLSLKGNIEVKGNDLICNDEELVIITGANRGGKTIFLKSIGENQILFQSGLITLATEYKSRVFKNIFTHFKREEDRGLTGGKLEEELKRMGDLMGEIKKGSLVLFNEAFSSTNDRAGKVISDNIVNGLIESEVEVLFVTHNYNFSEGLWELKRDEVKFLRASRERNFRLEEGSPLKKSYGEDIWNG
ncbi:MAG: MutS-related protein [Clostridium sp.]